MSTTEKIEKITEESNQENQTEQKEELDYKRAYLRMFNRISDMIEQLKEMQCEAEEICISDDNDSDE